MKYIAKFFSFFVVALFFGCAAYSTPNGVVYGFDPGRVANAGTGAAVGAALGGAFGGWPGAGAGALVGGAIGAETPSYYYPYSPYDDYGGGGYQQQYYQQKPCQVYWSGTWRDGQWVRTGQYSCEQSIDAPPPAPPMPPPQ